MPTTRFWVWSLIALLVALRLVTTPAWTERRSLADPPLRAGPCEVVEVRSGDTLLVRQEGVPGEVIVRLIGIAATTWEESPELAGQASDFSRQFCSRGEVRLALDNHRLDRQGRYLAYVEVEGQILNEALLAAGLARFDYLPGNSQARDRQLTSAEDEAKRAQRGIWAATK